MYLLFSPHFYEVGWRVAFIIGSEIATFNHLPPHNIFNYSLIELVCTNKMSFTSENFYERFFQVALCRQPLKSPIGRDWFGDPTYC